MKIKSINSKRTISPSEVAFNLDGNLTEYAVGKITSPNFYGDLSISYDGKCLLVSIDTDDAIIGSSTVASLNEKIAAICAEEENIKRKHDEMVHHVAQNTKLPIY